MEVGRLLFGGGPAASSSLLPVALLWTDLIPSSCGGAFSRAAGPAAGVAYVEGAAAATCRDAVTSSKAVSMVALSVSS